MQVYNDHKWGVFDRSGNIPIEFLEGFSIKDLPWKN
jgi:hypothetical protein